MLLQIFSGPGRRDQTRPSTEPGGAQAEQAKLGKGLLRNLIKQAASGENVGPEQIATNLLLKFFSNQAARLSSLDPNVRDQRIGQLKSAVTIGLNAAGVRNGEAIADQMIEVFGNLAKVSKAVEDEYQKIKADPKYKEERHKDRGKYQNSSDVLKQDSEDLNKAYKKLDEDQKAEAGKLTLEGDFQNLLSVFSQTVFSSNEFINFYSSAAKLGELLIDGLPGEFAEDNARLNSARTVLHSFPALAKSYQAYKEAPEGFDFLQPLNNKKVKGIELALMAQKLQEEMEKIKEKPEETPAEPDNKPMRRLLNQFFPR